MTSYKSFAYDIAVKNADGVTIYYNYINDGKELEVTSRGIYINETIVIPEEVTYINSTWKVTSIGDFAFSGSSNTSSINIPSGITKIGLGAFSGCSSLTSITIPNSVYTIGDEAFRSCSSLTSVNIGDGVTSIGNNAFYCCESLTSITIPNSVMSIGDWAFYLNSSLTSVIIGDGVTSIGNYAFGNCKSLNSVTIGQSVTIIRDYAFYNSAVSTILSRIENPFEITWKQFDDYSFANATLYVPKGTVDKYKAKAGWKDFKHIEELGSGEDTGNTEKDGLSFRITSSNECEVVHYDGDSDYIEIPEQVTANGKGYIVTAIGDRAFYNCHVASVYIPSSVTSIGDEAFRKCEELTSVNIPNHATKIGEWAFSGTAITYMAIPNSVTTLAKSIFNGCENLATVIIPNSVTSIEYKAFYRCRSLANINIPNSVTSIGELAFWECRSLTSLTIPSSVTSIGAQAFSGEDEDAPNILTVVSQIKYPFEILGKTSYNKNEYIGIFSQKTFINATLYVPKGTIEKYKTTDGWKDFAHIEENPNDTGLQTIISNNRTKDIFSIKGEKLLNPSKGLNIIRMKNGTTKKVMIK